MTKERSILYTGAMVRSILAGLKSQTRRLATGVAAVHATTGEALAEIDSAGPRVDCPYGKRGDRLYVREAWRTLDELDHLNGTEIADACINAGYSKPWAPVQYEADGRQVNWQHTSTPPHDAPPRAGRYRHARFMPRWASRILLEVTAVRIEHLQDIGEVDAAAEGLYHDDSIPYNGPWFLGPTEPQGYASAVDAYRALWESLNGQGSWDANPKVWVVEFRRVWA